MARGCAYRKSITPNIANHKCSAAAAIAAVGGQFVREDFQYSDDYESYHRLLLHGDIVRLRNILRVYRPARENRVASPKKR